MANHSVLVVDDDDTILEVLKYNLTKEGFKVLTAINGAEALEVARKEKPSLIILDLMLPELGGLEVCRILRRESTVPIIILTAKTTEIDCVVGLEVGADDYIVKPFKVRELIARVHANLRRSRWMDKPDAASNSDNRSIITAGDLEVDLKGCTVSLAGKQINLSPKEYGILSYLVRYQKRVFSRDHLIQQIWGYDQDSGARTIDVHISSLRHKLGDDANKPQKIITVRGFGYRFQP